MRAVSLVSTLLLMVASCHGSKILLNADPGVITSNLTQAMSMRCSLNETDPLLVTTPAAQVIGRRDVLQTSDNIHTVTSIVITRNNGDPVAQISIGQQPKANADLANMRVTGDLSGSGAPGEQGYLELNWTYPTTAQTGEYMCEINTIDQGGHNIVFSNTYEIGEDQPTIGSLLGRLLDLEASKVKLQQELTDLENNITSAATATAPPPTCPTYTTPTASVTGGAPMKIEKGRIECYDSGNWGTDHPDTWAKSTIKTQQFKNTYSTKPTVFISVASLDHEDGESIRYDTMVTSVSTTEFSAKCKTWAGSHIYHLWMDYIVIGN